MAEALILEFEGFGPETYASVNEILGIDATTGEGDWPEGLISHTGAVGANGFVVFEVWSSRADQERFMAERLGAALAKGGAEGSPSRQEWLEVAGHQQPGEG